MIPSLNIMDKLQQQDKTWAEFSTLEVSIYMLRNFGLISKTA